MGHSAVWRWPLVLAGLTLFGLLSALLGEGGVWWVLSWAALWLAATIGAARSCGGGAGSGCSSASFNGSAESLA
jgi:hypothetical protein